MKIIIISVIILFIGIFLYLGFYGVTEDDKEKVIFIIEEGQGVLEISQNLEKKGVIGSRYFFSTYVFLKGERASLKTGVYEISSGMSVSQIADKLISGKIKRNTITIVEGWNLNDIANYLEREGYGSKEEFYRLAGTPPRYVDGKVKEQKAGEIKEDFSFLEEVPDNLPLEGYLFPDTYIVNANAEIEDIIKVLLRNFENRVAKEVDEENIFEIIILASLIEKEVRTYEDKRLVSGIMRNRLEAGMPLQIDATITYLTGKRSVSVSILETRINSPYNTYVNLTLPLGPISNPGMESIRAAMNPKKSDYYYYLSKPTGETVFSRTLEEHNYAKNKYLR